MARGERTDIEMLGEIDVSTGQGVSSPAIQAALAKLYGRNAPGLRTIQERVKEFRAQSTGDLWTLADTDDPAEALHILDVRRGWVLNGQRPHQFKQDEAKWVGKIYGMVPDLPPLNVWFVARLYQRYHTRTDKTAREITEGLEYFLAFAPWRDEAHFLSYRRAVESGLIPQVIKAAWDYESRINGEVTL